MKKALICTMVVFALAVLGFQALGQGVILWDEALNGELSQDGGHPTSLTPLLPGTNSVLGTTEVVPYGNNWGSYPEFFTIEVPSNLILSAVYLTVDKPKVWAWIGDPAYFSQLGWTQNPTNGDLLTQWGLGSVPTGSYGIDLDPHDQQAVASIADYRLDFVTQPAPEPCAAALISAGAALFALRYLRRTRSARP